MARPRWGKRYVDKFPPRRELMDAESRVVQQIREVEESLLVTEDHIGDGIVSNAKLADMDQARIKGRASGAGTGDPTDLTAAQVRTIINVEDGATADQTAAEILAALLTVDGSGSGLDADLLDGQSSAAFAAASHAHSAADLTSGIIPDARMPNLTGDVTTSEGAVATTIANDAVTYAKLQNISAQFRMLGRNSASAGDTEEVTLSQFLDWVGSAANGDMLIRSAGAWTRRGIGSTADILRVVSGVPTWVAPRLHVMTITRAMDAASGSVAYTGVGFQPKVIAGLAAVSSGGNGTRAFSAGFSSVTVNGCVYNYTAGPGFFPTAQFIRLAEDVADTIGQAASVTSMDSDGFTLAWTRSGASAAATASVQILALG